MGNDSEKIEKVKSLNEEESKLSKKELKAKRKEELKLAQKKVQKKVNSFFADFKKFISKGNIIDLSVAVVIGAAFNKIVSSLVNNIIMPLISLAVGGVAVTDWKWVIKKATYDGAGNLLKAETALQYGIFIQAIIDFLIIALTIFIVLKIIVNSERGVKGWVKKFKKQNKDEEVIAPPPPPPVKIESQEDILKDIRELLKKENINNIPDIKANDTKNE